MLAKKLANQKAYFPQQKNILESQKLSSKVDRLNPGIRANDDSGQKLRKLQKCRSCLVQTGFAALYEIDPKVKGTPFARFRN